MPAGRRRKRAILICRKLYREARTQGLPYPAQASWKRLQPLCAVLHHASRRENRDTSQYPPHRARTQQPAAIAYLIGTRQTRNQYENAIKPSMNKTEHQFNRISSTCWFGTPLQERAPQASQYPSSSVATVRHSQHSFNISRIMPEARGVSHSQWREKS